MCKFIVSLFLLQYTNGSSFFFFRSNGKTGCWIPQQVDGMDFLPKPFAKDFFSNKFGKAGLQSEVGVCIQTGLIVWINGPFTAGKFNDITIFHAQMIYKLLPWEMVEADQCYEGQPNKIWAWSQFDVKTCGETINGRFKNF